ELLHKAKMKDSDTEVIVVTGHGDIQSAVAAMSLKAFYYLLKPLDLIQLRAVAARAAEDIELRRTNRDLQRRLDERFGFEGVIGSSPLMWRLIERLKRVAPTNATVMIQGDTGTGKELVAQAIHQNSLRKGKRFVALNCAALSSQILESELFGHVRGAFTDASSNRVGKFEYAHGGTLFLDEVSDMPLSTQIQLLRVLETREITPVGSNEPIKVDVRIISATNRDLEQAVEEGTFRQDMMERLNGFPVRLPSLQERLEDLPQLVNHFVKHFSKEYGKKIERVSPVVRERLRSHPWKGNVRELRNKIESMVLIDDDGELDLDDLPDALREAPKYIPGGNGLSSMIGRPLRDVELLFIEETLKFTAGNREEAARLLDISERSVYRKINELKKKENEG
ncbi:MAG: sigma-54 dependent transcriptional regulator, partial [Planctomycetales bacterium]